MLTAFPLSPKEKAMDLTCQKCGFKGDYLEFTYLCKNGCPACGESDLRRCPQCGAQCVFHRAEALEEEEIRMRELVDRLSVIGRASPPGSIAEARRIISELSRMNLRWNSSGLRDFLKSKQREILW